MHMLQRHQTTFIIALLAAILICFPAHAQDSNASDQTAFTGSVVSSTRNTLVVRNSAGQYQLFVFDRQIVRPSTPAGTQVRVTSTAGDEPAVRIASAVTIVSEAPAGQSGPTSGPPVPAEVRRLERDLQRQVRRYQVGVRAGVGLDPELMMIGVHAQVGPFFNSDVFLRPSVEFGFGEVTALFGLNLEAIYRLPITSRQGRWTSYVGAGPGFNFIHQNFDKTTNGKRIDFGDFHSDTGLNILGGLRYRSGTFMELKTSVYTDSAPTLRFIVGYNF
jgi:RNase P/RNase MRP subunit p29